MFKTFPEFSKLTLADREEYESFIKDFPPVADISFASLMTWWDSAGSADVAVFHGNLVVSYWLPGDDEHSGLSLIGTKAVEESICAIFDYLRERGERPRLVGVPDFVVHQIQYHELFRFSAQTGGDEYVVSLSRLSSLPEIPFYRRAGIKKFMQNMSKSEVAVKSVDLSKPQNRALLWAKANSWPKKGLNNTGSVEMQALAHTIAIGQELTVRNVCLFIDGELEGFCLYHLSHDAAYVITDHGKFNYDISNIFAFISYAFARYFVQEEGAKYANLHGDLGVTRLRILKLALQPSHFFRKYVIEPAR